MSHNPFMRSRPNPKRTEPRRTRDRVILRGEAKTQKRREIFERSGGFCEATQIIPESSGWSLSGEPLVTRCCRPITWETFEWSHPRHGPYRDDREGIASCKECHRNAHNAGGKPCARKAGRKMNQKEALAYWKGSACFCGGEKRGEWSFCPECLAKLEPQLQYDVSNATGEDYLRAMALAEQALLSWRPNAVNVVGVGQ